MPSSPASPNPPDAEPLSTAAGSFDWQPVTRVVFGAGVLARLGEWTTALGAKRPMLVTDPGIEGAGHADRALASLREAGFEPVLYDGVEQNPTTRHVDRGAERARAEKIDLLIGLGGGSAMDTAKGINFILTNGGSMRDYWGVGKATQPMLPLIAIPTTAGTGSEAQSFCLITDEQTHEKMACGDKKAAPRLALLDPEVTLSQPDSVTALVGIDAISHAVESWVTRSRNPISMMFAREAWRRLAAGFPRVIEDPTDLEARSNMLLGANLAGSAIEASMLGATHSCANPLTAEFGLTHGLAIGLMLPHVIRWNAQTVEPLYHELTAYLPGNNGSTPRGAEGLAHAVETWVRRAGLPQRLSECGVVESAIPSLARQAAAQWTAGHNPRPLGEGDFEILFRQAL